MGIRERNTQAGSGYKLVTVELPWQESIDTWFHTVTDPTIGSVIDVSAFSGNKQMMTTRTITVTLVTSATAGQRTLRVKLGGVGGLGKGVSSFVNFSTTSVSTTIRAETYDVFSFLESIEPLAGSTLIAGDVLRVGMFFDFAGSTTHAKTVFFGLPLQLKGTRMDTTAGTEGWKVDRGELIVKAHLYGPFSVVTNTFVHVLIAPADLRYDEARGGFNFIATGLATPASGSSQKMHMVCRVVN